MDAYKLDNGIRVMHSLIYGHTRNMICGHKLQTKEKIIKIHRKLLKLFELFSELDVVSYIAQWACITDPCIIKFTSFSNEVYSTMGSL